MKLEESFKEYWSKSEAFLLPLTGLGKDTRFEPQSYLFWRNYSIDNYQLILIYNDDEGIERHLRNVVFPVLDKRGLILENFDIMGRTIFILDISMWARDVENFLKGNYSLMSQEAKYCIEQYHLTGKARVIETHIFASLYPLKPTPAFGDKSALQYLADEFGFSMESLTEKGEIGSKYDRLSETLLTDIEELM